MAWHPKTMITSITDLFSDSRTTATKQNQTKIFRRFSLESPIEPEVKTLKLHHFPFKVSTKTKQCKSLGFKRSENLKNNFSKSYEKS
ncbi:hypothetical protein MTR_8g078050 [Medicago truncatula]|uniref:Uncharacterized protein n=1 Tax=Medicago truncatula TaxID=3880 RepID=G7LEV9_MEDTR|nr:hypothetical protein MTR_8g078050 [Medicago truncatula]